MELGKVLVSELKLEDSRDTLAKWLAHHVAELIVTAEKERNPVKRKRAAEQAVDTILRIWSQRDHLPGNANPFAPYRNILQILSALTTSTGSWPAHTMDHPVTNLYRRFPRLIRALLVLQLPRSGKGSRKARQIVHRFLEDDESRLLHQFQIRLRIIGVEEDTDKDAEPKDEFARVERLAEKLISETIADLNAATGQGLAKHKRYQPGERKTVQNRERETL